MAYVYSSSIPEQALFGDISDMIGPSLKKTRLYKLGQAIDWEVMCEPLREAYSIKGRNCNGVRQMLALEIYKHINKGVSDEDIVTRLRSDMALMHFCGILNVNDPAKEIDSSSMTYFREKLASIPGLIERMQAVHVEIIVKQKVPYRKRGQYDQDSTVIEEKIAYPNDVDLLAKLIEKGAKLTNKGKDFMGDIREKVLNKGKRNARKLQLSYHFGKEKGKEKIEEIKKGLIAIGNKMVDQMELLKGSLEMIASNGNKQAVKLQEKRLELIETGSKVLEQQTTMIKNKTKSITNRIVAIHKTYIRPIIKGKVGKAVEFGAKAQIGVIGGKVAMILQHDWDNVHDSTTVQTGIKLFQGIRGKKPKEAGFDKGYRNKKVNDPYLKEVGIENGIQGSEEWKSLSKTKRKRLYNRRAFIEPIINDIKNHRGSNKNLYKESNAKIGLFIATMASNYVRMCI